VAKPPNRIGSGRSFESALCLVLLGFSLSRLDGDFQKSILSSYKPNFITTMRKKIKTMDEFAGMIHKDYMALDKKITKMGREQGGMKLELNGVKFAVKELQEDVKHINENMVSKADLAIAIRDEFNQSEHGKRIENLRDRMERVEDKLDIKSV
jgi:hypothetical protein